MKTLRTTRTKRNYQPFRNNLRQALAQRGLSQSQAAKMMGMDVRTFNHVIAGPTHPDLQFHRDLWDKLGINLNPLFCIQVSEPEPHEVFNRLHNFYEGEKLRAKRHGELEEFEFHIKPLLEALKTKYPGFANYWDAKKLQS